MSFREIRPSFVDSSTPGRNPSQSTSESTSSDPRHARNEHVIQSGSSPSRRRRRPDTITRNACASCKKARSKCDGRQPCSRCALRPDAPDCIYILHSKHAKEELIKEAEELKAKYGLAKSILEALRNDEMVPEILERLKRGDKYEDIIERVGRTPDDDYETMSPSESQHSPFEASDQEGGGAGSAVSWTTVDPRQPVIDHLFQLYFSWVHPVHTLFDEGRFAQSHNHNVGEYCSSILVNALCAMACHLHRNKHDDHSNLGSLGEGFIEAVQAEIHPDDYKLTTVQACGVMFLVDCAEGRGLRGASYLKHALSILPSVIQLDSEGFAEVWATTIRGIRNLSIEWAQMTFQAPGPSNPVPFEDTTRTIAQDNSMWHYYRFMNDEAPYWPSLFATTNQQKSALLAIINDTTTMMYSQFSQPISAIEILKYYRRFTIWRNDLPSALTDIEDHNAQPLPHVLSLLYVGYQPIVKIQLTKQNIVFAFSNSTPPPIA
ncbi:hypothetical protein B7494_g8248 [Chlorociboria aeruginascens]|nr:hypothetical protein B7494_g8248 [Chlorociboria aeruginascens]